MKCRSMCVDSLKLYFMELPHTPEQTAEGKEKLSEEEKKKKTQEDLLAEMTMLVSRDVVGKITFPMIHICRAEVRVTTDMDGTHTFIFTDGVYGFTVHLDMPKKGRPRGIEVRDLNNSNPTEKHCMDAAQECAA